MMVLRHDRLNAALGLVALVCAGLVLATGASPQTTNAARAESYDHAGPQAPSRTDNGTKSRETPDNPTLDQIIQMVGTITNALSTPQPSPAANGATAQPNQTPPPASPMTRMPNVRNLYLADAFGRLAAQGLKASRIVSAVNPSTPTPVVYDQSPAPEQPVNTSTTITLFAWTPAPAPPSAAGDPSGSSPPDASGVNTTSSSGGAKPSGQAPRKGARSTQTTGTTTDSQGSGQVAHGQTSNQTSMDGDAATNDTTRHRARPTGPWWWPLAIAGAMVALLLAAPFALAALISVRPAWDPIVDTSATISVTHAGPDLVMDAWLEPGDAGPEGPLPILAPSELPGSVKDV